MHTHDATLVAPQYDTLEQQHESNTFGMWVFLANEITFFGGMFAAYMVYRFLYPEVWAASSHHLDQLLGTINTAVLLTSSFTMALGVHYAHIGKQKNVFWMLVLTFLLSCAFLVIKAVEWTTDYHEGLIPGRTFTYDGPYAKQTQLFFCLYFIMTGLHGLHVLIGMGLMIWLMIGCLKGSFEPPRYQKVEMTGLYWHFVDLVWIFLYPLFYLIGGN